MDQLKTYAVPLVALVLLLVWFFVIRPAMDTGEGASPDAQTDKAEKAEKTDAKAGG